MKRKLKTTTTTTSSLDSNNSNIGGDFSSAEPILDNNIIKNHNNNNNNRLSVDINNNNNNNNNITTTNHNNNSINNNNNNTKSKSVKKYKISLESSNEIRELFKQSARIILEIQSKDPYKTGKDISNWKCAINQLIKELVFLMNENEFMLDDDNSGSDIGSTTSSTSNFVQPRQAVLLEDRLKTIKDHIESLKNIVQFEKLKYKKELQTLKLLKNEPDSIETIRLLNEFKQVNGLEKHRNQQLQHQNQPNTQTHQRRKEEYPSIKTQPPLENINFLKLNI